MRIGIIGAGVSGMATAWLLQHDHQVTLFDGSPQLGGHAETLPVTVGATTVHAEVGPRFFFDSAYPHFLALLRVLDVPIRWWEGRVSFTDMTDASRARTVVLPPRTPRHVAALLRWPSVIPHLLSMRHLIAEQPGISARRDFSVTFRRHLDAGGYRRSFGPEFVYPFLAACWGAPMSMLPDFPAYSLLKGMPPGNKAGFYEIPGGWARYVRAFGEELTNVDVRLGAAVRRVGHHDQEVVVEDALGERRRFDHVIVATGARDAAALLRDVPAADEMRAAVGALDHFETDIVIHGDASYMPKDRWAWTHNNLFYDGETAWMTDWQGLGGDVPVFRTWLPAGRPLPSPLHGRRKFQHLVMRPENAILQRRIAAVQGRAGIWVTGMYAVDVDNHESALLSALVPARALAPEGRNLRRLLEAVPPGAAHGLEVLPVPATPSLSR